MKNWDDVTLPIAERKKLILSWAKKKRHTDDHDRLIGYKTVPSIFNDEAGERTKGSYWHTIIPSTLREVPQQKMLFGE